MTKCLLPILVMLVVTAPTAAQLFRASIDPQLEAEYLAVKTTGELRPMDSFATEIKADLAAIRAAFPEVADYRAFEQWFPGAIWLQLTPEAFIEFQNGSFRNFDPLFNSLGTPQIRLSFFNADTRYMALAFGRVYHSERLAELFRDIEGVDYADAEWSAGDGGEILVEANHTYTIIHGFGDCPSGCLSSISWTFKVTNDDVNLLNRSGSHVSLPFVPLQPLVPEPPTAAQMISIFICGLTARFRTRQLRPGALRMFRRSHVLYSFLHRIPHPAR